ncbi:hypothetical protein TNCV_3509251 [Trichonephila clavipes]|nr:hypothetical protein TNCV_3509251 [Trichonephila clavipes]
MAYIPNHGCCTISQTNSLAIPVPKPKHNTAFAGFTRVDDHEACNTIQKNARICHSRRMEQNNYRRDN